jgi:hypothetical protein
MTELEQKILELAAKAAGYRVCHFLQNGAYVSDDVAKRYFDWNPRHDDGDSRRLEVKLSMCVTQFLNTSYSPHVMVGYSTGAGSGSNIIEKHNSDPYDATRLAVLQAAAMIGEAMK